MIAHSYRTWISNVISRGLLFMLTDLGEKWLLILLILMELLTITV
jgi:hypothetical protein